MAEHMFGTHAALTLSPSIRKEVRREEETVYRNRKLDKEIGEKKHWGTPSFVSVAVIIK